MDYEKKLLKYQSNEKTFMDQATEQKVFAIQRFEVCCKTWTENFETFHCLSN